MKNSLIGIFGGTFDPVHMGHIHLIKKIQEQCNLHKIILVPCNCSPFRTEPLANSQDRFDMLKLATKQIANVVVEDYEISRPTPSYTINTVKYLREKYPKHSLCVIMGMDVFSSFNRWYKFEEILTNSHLIITNRINYQPKISEETKKILKKREILIKEQLQNSQFGLIYQIDIAPLSVSATKIRRLVKDGKDIKNLVTPKVLEYIKQKNLYTI